MPDKTERKESDMPRTLKGGLVAIITKQLDKITPITVHKNQKGCLTAYQCANRWYERMLKGEVVSTPNHASLMHIYEMLIAKRRIIGHSAEYIKLPTKPV